VYAVDDFDDLASSVKWRRVDHNAREFAVYGASWSAGPRDVVAL